MHRFFILYRATTAKGLHALVLKKHIKTLQFRKKNRKYIVFSFYHVITLMLMCEMHR